MPLADVLMERFKVRTRAVENPLGRTSLGTTAELILGNNPNRFGWVIINLSGNVVYLSFTHEVSDERGIRLNANGGLASMVWDEDFEPTAWAIWGVASAADSNIYSFEIVEA